MELAEAEARLGITLPERHRRAMLDPTDPIHEWCDFLVPDSPYELLRWVGVNEFLHAPDHWKRWPPFLVAFVVSPRPRWLDPTMSGIIVAAAAYAIVTFARPRRMISG